MENRTLEQRIREYYDVTSPIYQELWGGHIHHGYYRTGRESKKEAIEELIKVLAKKSSLKSGSKVLDVGCGIGGTSIWLTENFNCEVTGITISPRQVEMAHRASVKLLKKPKFMVMDANDMVLNDTFDVVWAVEVLSHLQDHSNFFRKSRQMLKKGGKLCVAAWMKEDDLTEREERKYIRPVEEGMFCLLPTAKKYLKLLDENRFNLVCYEDISLKVKKTWDMGLEIIKDKSLWRLAAHYGKEGFGHLKAFRSMKKGYAKGKLLYMIIVAEKL